jgi:hypothetical protein
VSAAWSLPVQKEKLDALPWTIADAWWLASALWRAFERRADWYGNAVFFCVKRDEVTIFEAYA